MMKNLLPIIFISIIFINKAYCQIDTSENYPLAIGNYWEYTTYEYPPYYSYVTVLKDTILANGKMYKVMQCKGKFADNASYSTYYEYQRITNNCLVYKYQADSTCTDKEILVFDFSAPSMTFWEICGNLGHYFRGYRFFGIRSLYNEYNPVVGKVLETRYFTTVVIDTTKGFPDTIWTPFYGLLPEYFVAKGLGPVTITTASTGGDYILNGAIINGVKYGHITGIKENEKTDEPVNYNAIESYPNPFNGQVNIKVTNSSAQYVELTVFDILGREVKKLYNGYLEKGSYDFRLSSANLPSGTYLVCFKTPVFIKTYKILNLK